MSHIIVIAQITRLKGFNWYHNHDLPLLGPVPNTVQGILDAHSDQHELVKEICDVVKYLDALLIGTSRSFVLLLVDLVAGST
jgi:hypothetical protein